MLHSHNQVGMQCHEVGVVGQPGHGTLEDELWPAQRGSNHAASEVAGVLPATDSEGALQALTKICSQCV